MDLTIDQGSLARALKLAARIAATRTALPVLQTVLLTAEPGQLTMSACDLDRAVRTVLAADVSAPGQVAVGARLLADYVAQLPATIARLSLDRAKGRLKVVCERATAGFASTDPADFPVLPGAAEGGLEFDAAAFGRALARVLPATAREHAGIPALTNVRFGLDDDGLTLAACDGVRLARVRVLPDSAGAAEPRQLLVPQRGATEMARLLDGARAGAAAVRLAPTADERGVWLSHGDIDLYARLAGGAFPEVDPLIPRDWATRVTVGSADLRNALRLGALFGEGELRPVLLDASCGRLRVLAGEGAGGNTETVLSNVTVEGAEGAIMLDAPRLVGCSKPRRAPPDWRWPGLARTPP